MAAISIVVPVLDDGAALARLLSDLPPDPRLELVVVDGGEDPAVSALAADRPDMRVIRAGRGRGRQMNAGAASAGGDWLLFLHADSRLPPGWVDAILALPPGTAGGWFRFAFDDPAWQARLIERGVSWRVRLMGLPYGDQGFFVRRATFDALGGYGDMPLLEDVDFVRRLRRAGPVVELPLPLATSARRYRRDGWLRRSARNVLIVHLYLAGIPPARLARWY